MSRPECNCGWWYPYTHRVTKVEDGKYTVNMNKINVPPVVGKLVFLSGPSDPYSYGGRVTSVQMISEKEYKIGVDVGNYTYGPEALSG